MGPRRGARSESRSESFSQNHQPFQDDRSLNFRSATGTFSFMNPTRARFECATRPRSECAIDVTSAVQPVTPRPRRSTNGRGFPEPQSLSTSNEAQPLLGAKSRNTVSFLWRSRDNRKGRHALLVRPMKDTNDRTNIAGLPLRTNTILTTLQGIKAMCTRFPYWDLSWMLAVTYTTGSLVWVLNAFIIFFAITEGKNWFPFDVTSFSGWSAFVGGTVFFIASILMMTEVLGASITGCFGWEVEQTSSGSGEATAEARPAAYEHHHQGNEENVVGEGQDEDEEDYAERGQQSPQHASEAQRRSNAWWRWSMPTWEEVTQHYLYEISFVACSVQMIASVLFWGSKFLAIPPISALVSHAAMVYGYYMPTVMGGLGFIVASALLMLETQPRWYIPAPGVLGWHVCFWKLVGSVGFTVSGAIGPFRYAHQGAFHQSNIATLWGSLAMLLGSLLQWFESLDKHPVVEEGEGSTAEWHASWEKGFE